MIVLYVLGALVLSFFAWVAVVRLRQRAHEGEIREAIRAYVETRGGSVVFDGDGMLVKGPLGEGRKRLAGLHFMCKPGERARWDQSIGIVLRDYIPDALAERAAKVAKARLAELLPQVEALSEGDLRGRLRVKVTSKRAPAEGLATCARPLGERFEARVVVDGLDLGGIPSAARARLAEADAAIFAVALTATLGDLPDAAAGGVDEAAWLCDPGAIFGERAFLIACEGTGLAWLRAERGTAQQAVAALATKSMSDGPRKAVMFGWDGAALSAVGVLEHTIIGPTTPDYTLTLAPSMVRALGVVAGADGQIGVRRR